MKLYAPVEGLATEGGHEAGGAALAADAAGELVHVVPGDAPSMPANTATCLQRQASDPQPLSVPHPKAASFRFSTFPGQG